MRTFPSESTTFTDRESGVTIRRLTDYRGHSNHLYFTNTGWWDEGRRLVFASDRDTRQNLFSVDLDGGEITQVTDLSPDEGAINLQTACLNPKRGEAYF